MPENAHWPLVAGFSARFVRGRPDVAPTLYRRLLPYSGQCACGGMAGEVSGFIDTHLGTFATASNDWAAAEAHFESGSEGNRRTGNRPAAAESLFRWSEMLARRDGQHDATRATEMLHEGLAICDELGLRLYVDDATELLHSLEN